MNMKEPVNVIKTIDNKEILRIFLLEIVRELKRKDIDVKWHMEEHSGIMGDDSPCYKPGYIELDFSYYNKILYEKFKREK